MPLPDMVALWVKADNIVMPEGDSYVPVMKGEETLDPVEAMEFLSKKYERFLLLDIDGIESGKPQLELFQDCAFQSEIWVDAGTSDPEDATDITVSGASRVLCGTKSLRSWEDLEGITDMLENVVFSLDVSEDIVAPFINNPELESILDEVTTLPLAGGLLMDIKGRWTNPRNIKEMAESFKEFYFSVPNGGGLLAGLEDELLDKTGRVLSFKEALDNMDGEAPWTQGTN